MAFTLPDLPYDPKALTPHISAETLSFHHGKHHAAYLTNLNKLIAGTPDEEDSLEGIIKSSVKDPSKAGLFNNAAQAWNHDFYWKSMSPKGGGRPDGDLSDLIARSFGSYENFIDAFKTSGATQFGSGWAWLVLEQDKLAVRKTPNAETPLTETGVKPLITMDVWEHAYYLDYQNRRPDYMGAFLEHLINWNFALDNLKL